MQVETPFKSKIEGYGIKPDIRITPTQKDRAQQLDPEFEWILNTVENKNPSLKK